jgi:ribosomal protein S27AE
MEKLTAQELLALTETFSSDLMHSELAKGIDFDRSKIPGFDKDDTIIQRVQNPKWVCPTCGKDVIPFSHIPQLIQCAKCGNMYAASVKEGTAQGGAMAPGGSEA